MCPGRSQKKRSFTCFLEVSVGNSLECIARNWIPAKLKSESMKEQIVLVFTPIVSAMRVEYLEF